MDIKFDINRLIDRLCNAERTVGEQATVIAELEKLASKLREEVERNEEKNIHLAKHNEALQEELKSERETASFWYNKALELGWEYKPLTNAAEGEFAHGA